MTIIYSACHCERHFVKKKIKLNKIKLENEYTLIQARKIMVKDRAPYWIP